ncbi:MAG: hypothetical protein ACFB2Z_03355 [Maricaulaceae bacterium]
MYRRLTAAAVLAVVCGAPGAGAQIGTVDFDAFEIAGGVASHDLPIGGGDLEDGPDIVGQVYFPLPEIARYIGRPRFFVGGNLNTSGDTSFGGFGLSWRWDVLPESLSRKIYIQGDFGYTLHTGEISIPDAMPGDPPDVVAELNFLNENTIEFGSRDLFRSAFAVGWRLNERIALEGFIEHLSHGQIIGGPENDALNNAGGRIAFQFGR